LKNVKIQLGVEDNGKELLGSFENSTENESPREMAKWATSLSKHLEKNIDEKDLIEIREECAMKRNT